MPRGRSLTLPPGAVRRALPLACLLFFLLDLAAYWPGVWDSDTHAQSREMLARSYADWHPPVMSALWGLLNRACNASLGALVGATGQGSGPIYLLHNLLYWSAMALLAWPSAGPLEAAWNRSRRRWALCVGLFVAAFAVERNLLFLTRWVWKDVGLTASYLLAFALALRCRAWPAPRRIAALALAAVCVAYGTAVRHNAVFSALPLLLLLLAALPGARFLRARPLGLLLAGLAVWGALLAGISHVNYDLLEARRTFPLQERYFADIFALDYKTKTFTLPPPVFGLDYSGLDEKTFRDFYQPVTYVKNAFAYVNKVVSPPLAFTGNRPTGPDDERILRQAWLAKILAHPGAYLEIRWKTFTGLLNKHDFLFVRGSIYLLALLPVCCLPLRRLRQVAADADDFAYLMLGWSALFYVLPYFVFLTDDEYRYLYWFFLAAAPVLGRALWRQPLCRDVLALVQDRLPPSLGGRGPAG